MTVTGTPANLVVHLTTRREVQELDEILTRANTWLIANDALPWPILRRLKAATAEALK